MMVTKKELDEAAASPKTKTEYVKVECDIWNISTLKDDFEAGNLFYDKTLFGEERDAPYGSIKTDSKLSACVLMGIVYRRIETPVTLESELRDLGFTDGFNSDSVSVMEWNYLTNETIHKLSEILKRHCKQTKFNHLV